MEFPPEFTLAELTASTTALAFGIDNSPPKEVIPNLHRLAQVLLTIRQAIGDLPIVVTSGYRCKQLNRAVGGSPTSSHMTGFAADIVCPRYGSALELARLIESLDLEFDQLILEKSKGKVWVHFSVDPRNRKAVMTYQGGKFIEGLQ